METCGICPFLTIEECDIFGSQKRKEQLKTKDQIDGYVIIVVKLQCYPQKPSATKFDPDSLLPKGGNYM